MQSKAATVAGEAVRRMPTKRDVAIYSASLGERGKALVAKKASTRSAATRKRARAAKK